MSIIRASEVLETTATTPNIPVSKIEPFLAVADMELKKLLGTTLYTTITTAQADNAYPTGYTAIDTLVTTYIMPYVAWRTKELALPHLAGFITPNGFHTTQGGDYIPGADRILKDQVHGCANMAKTYQEALLNYLNDNAAMYPDFATTVANEERVTKTYKGGIIFRKSRWQRPYGYDIEDTENDKDWRV